MADGHLLIYETVEDGKYGDDLWLMDENLALEKLEVKANSSATLNPTRDFFVGQNYWEGKIPDGLYERRDKFTVYSVNDQSVL